MSFSALFVVLGIVFMLVVLALDKMRPGLTLFSVAIMFLAAGIITPDEVIAGFSNKGMITVAILFLVSEGVRQSGSLNYIINHLLPRRKASIPGVLLRILPTTAFISSLLNNTAIIIIFAPIIKKWAEKMNIPATKFLIPLSYATILGGLCTLIGTSTNLVVHGMMIDSGYKGFSMFELGKVGIIITIVGIVYILIFSNSLLPGSRILKKDINKENNTREYSYDILIPKGSKIIGSKVRRNKFEALPMVDVCGIRRNGELIVTDGRTLDIEEGDILAIVGGSNILEHILNTRGIELACLKGAASEFVNQAIKQVEVVITPRFSGIGKTLKEFDFFRHYHAVVLALHRNGERVSTDIDSLILSEGDTLVLITDGSFVQTWGESSSFYMISERDDFKMPEKGPRKWFGFGLLLFMIGGATLGDSIPHVDGVEYDMFFFAAIVMVIMAWTKLFPAKKYTKYITWDILIAIASAFAISKAMENSGIADSIASIIIETSKRFGAHGALFMLFIITMIFTETITNNAAAALSFPIAIAVSERLGVDVTPFFVTICIAASASFSTPIGYQTNLIVQGVGGYKFKDYLRIGIPLNIITLIISVLLIPLIWKF